MNPTNKIHLDRAILEKIVQRSKSIRDLCGFYKKPINGYYNQFFKKWLTHYKLDTSHFSLERGLIMIECEQCNKKFKVAQRLVEKGRRFCSLSCSNKVARGNSLLQPDEKLTGQRKYIKICFRHHEKKCVICDESNIVTVHHFDGNHDNDSPENLIPVCPTHHSYVHSKFKNLVQPKIEEYRNNFILKKKQ